MPTDGLSAPQPSYVLRGHSAAIHALSFTSDNSRLLTGDADGWVASWHIALKRPVASWRAHGSAVLGLEWWESSRPALYSSGDEAGTWAEGDRAAISHGRDSKLIVWQLRRQDESELDAVLPTELQGRDVEGRKPKVLYQLELNTMNFCAFAWCIDLLSHGNGGTGGNSGEVGSDAAGGRPSILLAVPHTLDSESIDIFHLPSKRRLGTILAPKTSPQAGMIMTLSITVTSFATVVAAGYESGHAVVYANTARKPSALGAQVASTPAIFSDSKWQRLYLFHAHLQPILSLAVDPSAEYFVTSSADSVIAKHPLMSLLEKDPDIEGSVGNVEAQPLQITKTKHAGQQGICIRDDGKLIATAGWDSRIRVFSARSIKEVAVLKWHREGCYSTAFAHVRQTAGELLRSEVETVKPGDDEGQPTRLQYDQERRQEGGPIVGMSLVVADSDPEPRAVGSVAARREHKAQNTHWLAAGSKDGKVSLWDIY